VKTIVVASTNPVKVQATLNAFNRTLSDEQYVAKTVSVHSGVREQPLSSQETIQGALNRAQNAAVEMPGADYWVGIEGGVEETEGDLAAFAWVVVLSKDRVGKGRTGTFFLPEAVARLIRQGKELGEADDLVFNRLNSKQEDGAVGILTGNVVNRIQLYEHAVILALIPFKSERFYEKVAWLEE
jgi:inosine/xanthosine triphosphatase